MSTNKPSTEETQSTSLGLDEALRSIEESLTELERKTVEERPDPHKTLVVDMTELTGIPGSARRVVMQRTRIPAGYSGSPGELSPERLILGAHYVIGLIEENSLPKEGEHFEISQYMFDGVVDYGRVKTSTPITNVRQIGNKYFFNSLERDEDSGRSERVDWCVTVDPGN